MINFEANVEPYFWARVFDWLVDALPLNKLGFHDVLNSEGGPPCQFSDIQIIKYEKEDYPYTCPPGAMLTTNGRIYKKSDHRVKHYKTKACNGCNFRAKCTKKQKRPVY